MPEAYAVLAQGELPVAAGILYTVPALTETIVKHIMIVNQTAGALTITMWIDGNTDAELWVSPTFEIPANGAAEWSGSLSLETTVTIRGATAGGANDITYIISGVEIT